MEDMGRAYRLFLLIVAAASVSNGSDIREYYTLESTRLSDGIVFTSHNDSSPLYCEPETVGEWRLEPTVFTFLLSVPGANTQYRCGYDGNISRDFFWEHFQINLHDAIVRSGKGNLEFRPSELVCASDAQIPDEYFHLRIRRPLEDRPLRCRVRHLDDRLYIKFLRFPTIICRMGPVTPKPFHTFTLPGIVGDPFECAFLAYSDVRIGDTNTEHSVYYDLVSKFPGWGLGIQPVVKCSRNATTAASLHFLVRLPGGSLHDCSLYTS